MPSLTFVYNKHTMYFLEANYYKHIFHVHCGARWPINEWDVICKGAGWEVIITQYYIPPVFSVFRSLSYRCRFLSLSSPSTTRLSSPTTKFLLSISLTVLSLSSASVSASLFGPQLTDVCVLRKVTLCLQHQQAGVPYAVVVLHIQQSSFSLPPSSWSSTEIMHANKFLCCMRKSNVSHPQRMENAL